LRIINIYIFYFIIYLNWTKIYYEKGEITMISREEVQKISKLAMLELTEEEVSNYTRQLGGILGFFEELKELDLKNVEPANHAIITPDVTREDIVRPSRNQADIVGQSPATDGKNIIVPAIIETEE